LGYYGWEEHAPYDKIIVTAASEDIPEPLIEQLKDNGRMVIPIGFPYATQHLMLVTKSNGKISSSSLLPVSFVPFKGKH
jgi:protein-L-isoaspartate(D-aspartate) O-methyltransferase